MGPLRTKRKKCWRVIPTPLPLTMTTLVAALKTAHHCHLMQKKSLMKQMTGAALKRQHNNRRLKKRYKHPGQSQILDFRAKADSLARRGKRRRLTISSSSDGSSDEFSKPTYTASVDNISFYEKHHKHIKSLLPKHLPGCPRSFQEYLSRLFLPPDVTNVKRKEIYERSAGSSNFGDSRLRAFIATAFPPITVGVLADKEVEHTFIGDIFPQFSQHRKSRYQCEICVPYQKWAIKEGSRHALLKSKGANVSSILDGTALLTFSGVVQVHEHCESRAHKEAAEFFQSNDLKDDRKKDDSKPPRKEKVIQDFFKPKEPLN